MQPELVLTIMLTEQDHKLCKLGLALFTLLQLRAALLQMGAYVKASPIVPKDIGAGLPQLAPHGCCVGQRGSLCAPCSPLLHSKGYC